MRYLALALHAEGATDYRFLQPVIRRTVRDVVSRGGHGTVEVAEQFVDLGTLGCANDDILDAAGRALEAIDILFVHTDGKANVAAAFDQRVRPIIDGVQRLTAAGRIGCVGVVPVREMEAWPLADVEAIQRAFGSTKSAEELGVPVDPGAVEEIADPKRKLATAHANAVGGRKRRRRRGTYEAFLSALGEQVRLRRLERVPAYRRFRDDLVDALRALNVFD